MTSLRHLPSALALLAAAVSLRGQPIAIGDHKQLFIDDKFVAESSGVEWVMNSPVKHGAVLKGDKSWDKYQLSSYGTVMEDQGKFRLWYGARLPAPDGQDRIRGEIMYAESTDGICWDKPNLGICEWQGSKANNILMRATPESCGVFIDPKAPAAERYKIVGRLANREPRSPDGEAFSGSGLYMYTSPDGLHWTLHHERVFPFDPDTLNQAFYDESRGKYLAYVRTWNPLRRVGVVEMDDTMKPWPWDHNVPPRDSRGLPGPTNAPTSHIMDAFGTDQDEPADLDFYTSAVIKYPWADDAYFMFPSAYHHYADPSQGGRLRNNGVLDIDLAVSRDGKKFHRVSREPYVGLGPEGSFDSRTIYMLIGCLRRDGVLYQYYGGHDAEHGDAQGMREARHRAEIALLCQRLDGFISLNATAKGGHFVTPPVVFSGARLLLNQDVAVTGELRVELQDAAGQAIPGYSFADSDLLLLNDLAKVVTWHKGKADVSSLAGKPVRIAFRMRSAKLFAFQFSN